MRKEELAKDMDPDKLKVSWTITYKHNFLMMPMKNYITHTLNQS
jgi:hypothetical protein